MGSDWDARIDAVLDLFEASNEERAAVRPLVVLMLSAICRALSEMRAVR